MDDAGRRHTNGFQISQRECRFERTLGRALLVSRIHLCPSSKPRPCKSTPEAHAFQLWFARRASNPLANRCSVFLLFFPFWYRNMASTGAGLTLEELTRIQREFAQQRGWEKFHSPRNLILALVGEVGELSECFQWLGDDGAKPGLPGLSEEKRAHIGDELSDVLCYLVRVADVCQVDLSAAVLSKIGKNAEKYPADKAYGSCAKYTAYRDDGT